LRRKPQSILSKPGGTSGDKAAMKWQIELKLPSASRSFSWRRIPALDIGRKDLTADSVKFSLVYSYLIVYRPATKPLQVVAILQGRRDVEQILKDRLYS
jgi:hypothetical protein